jgi:ribosomal protein L21E
MSDFKSGTRVRIKKSSALGLSLPLRKWALEGRCGTVTGRGHAGAGVLFDRLRGRHKLNLFTDPNHFWLDVEYLELAPAPPKETE